jgi:translation initiation factor 3 subunit C
VKQIKNFRKIRDFAKLLTAFENLTKAYTKAKPVIDKEEGGVCPRFYVRCLVEMSDLIDQCWEDKEWKKNMNKNNSKALTTLRQKLRKYSKDFESAITRYRENPGEASGSEDEDRSDSDDDEDDVRKKSDDEAPVVQKKVPVAKTGSDDEDDSDESYWGEQTDSDSSSESGGEGHTRTYNSSYFLKKDFDVEKVQEDRKDKTGKRDKKDRPIRKIKVEDEDDGKGEPWQVVHGSTVVQEKPKLFAKDEEVNHAAILQKIVDILAMRGKKRIRRSDQLEMLRDLIEISAAHKLGPAIEIKLVFATLSALLSYNSTVNSCMRPSNWNRVLAQCTRMLDVLCANPDLSVGEKIQEDSECFDKSPYRVTGCPLTLIERIDDEFTKILQSVDAHSPDYIQRLKDEVKVVAIIDRLAEYLEKDRRGTSLELCRVYLLKIDHLYYKFDAVAMDQKEERDAKSAALSGCQLPVVLEHVSASPSGKSESKETSLDVMGRLCHFIYSNDQTDRIRTQAILYHIYHHALHDNWFEARDLMLMSHLQHNIGKSDIPLQIIYNRALVQLGLCAFRHGNIKDAHTALLDIQIQGRAKELLAQGLLPRQQERTQEQEKVEKRRLLPFHKHINLELLECVYLVSAMLLEIPDVAANEYSIRKKMISRSFYNQLRKNEEQPLVGLPESMREHVVAASKVMRVGNWKSCVEFIVNEKMNNKVWNLFHRPDKVREMLVRKIREESLRAYLFTYSHVYDSISLDVLSQMLDLDKATAHSIVSKMMTNEELMTSLDEPTQTLVMHRTEPSRMQGLSLQLADKINTLVEQNERLWEVKQSGAGFGGNTGRYDRKDGDMNRGGRNWTERLGYNENRNRGDGNRRGGRFDRRDNRGRDNRTIREE